MLDWYVEFTWECMSEVRGWSSAFELMTVCVWCLVGSGLVMNIPDFGTSQ